MAECNHCGGFVTDNYARVFGDNENRVEDCRNCPTVRTTDEAGGEDGREVLLREVRETAGRERDDVAEPSGADPVGDRESAGGIGADASGPDDETDISAADAVPEGENDEDDDTGSRIQASLSAMVSALRS